MHIDSAPRLARRLGLAAAWGGLTVISAVVLFDTLWPLGADFVKYGLPRRFEVPHHLIVLFWLPLGVALWAAAVALLADSAGLPRRGRPALLAIAIAGVLGSLYGLRFMAHADARLRDVGPWPWEPQAWLAWANAAIWAALLGAIVLAASALLTGRASPVNRGPAGTDILAMCVAFWASSAALVTLLVEAVRSEVWSSAAVDALVARGLGGQLWLATAAVVLAAICWPVVGIAAAIMAGRRSRGVWALLAAAGVCGLLVSASMAIVTARGWTAVDALVAHGPGDNVWALLEPRGEAMVATMIVHGTLVLLGGALVAAATRQYIVWRGGRTALSTPMGPSESSPPASRRVHWPIVAAVVAVTSAVLAPLIADALVTDGGAVLGTGGIRSPAEAAAAAAPTATSPTPIPTGDESPSSTSPRIIGVVPGNRRGDGEVRYWGSGDVVQVNIESNGVDLELAASELTINGEPVDVQPAIVTLTPATPTVVWHLDKMRGEGSYDFVVTLVATDGRRFAFGWSYSQP